MTDLPPKDGRDKVANAIENAGVVDIDQHRADMKSRGDEPKRKRRRAPGRAGKQPDDGTHGEGNDAGPPIDADIVKACSDEPQNDIGNARRLLHHFGSELINVRDVDWHHWAGTHWEAEGGEEAAYKFAHGVAERMLLEMKFVGQATEFEQTAIDAAQAFLEIPVKDRDPKTTAMISARTSALDAMNTRKSKRFSFAISTGNVARTKGMLMQAIAMNYGDRPVTIQPNQLDQDPLAFNVENGTLRFYCEPDPECPDPDVEPMIWKVRLDKHEPLDLISKLAPVKYDPDAKCPKWLEFMERFQPDKAVRDFLCEFHGYALTGLIDEQCLVFNYGTGANGKSTLIEALARLMGNYAQTLNSESVRSEERRVGKECRSRWSPYH